MLPLLVEPSELEPLLDDENLLVVDLCRDEIYQQYHLPGAVHVSPVQLVSGVKPATGKLPSLEQLEALFSTIGYTPDKHVVAYDDEGGGWAGRFIWTLDVIGHTGSSLLNGGLIAWAAEQRPLTNAPVEPVASEVSLNIHPDTIAEQADVMAAIDDDNVQVWDARSREEYLGLRTGSARAGHVPGAINIDWLELMDRDNHLRLIDNPAELIAARGILTDAQIITHCQTHHRSGLTYFVGKLLGRDIRAYHGSWSEWGNDPDTPIEASSED